MLLVLAVFWCCCCYYYTLMKLPRCSNLTKCVQLFIWWTECIVKQNRKSISWCVYINYINPINFFNSGLSFSLHCISLCCCFCCGFWCCGMEKFIVIAVWKWQFNDNHNENSSFNSQLCLNIKQQETKKDDSAINV